MFLPKQNMLKLGTILIQSIQMDLYNAKSNQSYDFNINITLPLEYRDDSIRLECFLLLIPSCVQNNL